MLEVIDKTEASVALIASQVSAISLESVVGV
jgi:hypothetical protein